MDCSPPGSSVHGILQARTLGCVATPFSRETFLTQGSNPVSHIAGGVFIIWATREVLAEAEASDTEAWLEAQILTPPLRTLSKFLFNWSVLLYIVVLISADQQSDSVIGVHISPPSRASIPPPPSHPSSSSQSTQLSSLYYTACSHQLPILHMVVNICRS